MYLVEFSSTARKDILLLPFEIQINMEIIFDRLIYQPRPRGCQKMKDRENTWRMRVGRYRILYEIDDCTKTITVFRIRHRKDVYR
jgi:mRNA interferase RelE/StbE